MRPNTKSIQSSQLTAIEPGLSYIVRWYVGFYCVCFALYAVFGRAFAYAGTAPLFVGEFLLGAGAFVAMCLANPVRLAGSLLGSLLILFGLWQACRTAPYLGAYGIDALRDAAAWGYAAFGWIVASILNRYPTIMDLLFLRYKRFASWYVLFGPLSLLTTWYLADVLPRMPGTNVSIPNLKAGDLLVHVAGIFTFFLAGMAPWSKWCLIPAFAGAFIGGTRSRGGLIAFLSASVLVAVVRLRSRQVWQMVGAVLAATVLLVVSGVHLEVPGSFREISADQLLANIRSVDSETYSDLETTKQWRLEWWNKIIDYTINGDLFWTGKGYGINLTEDDGLAGGGETPLRSPHNSHLTFLARSGVPGLLLWGAVQLTWLAMMIQSFVRSQRLNLPEWNAIFAWVVAYWLAFMINASFDVSLEGPMIAIPFWAIFGLGWAAHSVFASSCERVPRMGRAASPDAPWILSPGI